MSARQLSPVPGGRFVDTSFGPLHLVELGSGEPVLLVHGLGSAGFWDWRHNLRALGRRFRVVALDLPGHGFSAPLGRAVGLAALVEPVLETVEALGLERFHVTGTSLGGRVALALAEGMPGRVLTLALCDSLGFGEPSVRLSGLAYLPLLLPFLGPVAAGAVHRLARPLLRALSGRARDQTRALYLRALARPGFGAGYTRLLQSISRLGGMHREFMVLRRPALEGVPVLVIWGERDPIFPPEHGRRAQQLLPHSRLCVLKGAGHVVQAEQPARFNRLLLDHLRRHPVPPGRQHG